MIVIGNLNVKVGSGNTLLGHAVRRHGNDDRDHNGKRFVNFYDRRVMGTHGFRLTSNEHLITLTIHAVSSRLRSYMLNMRNKKVLLRLLASSLQTTRPRILTSTGRQ